MSKAQGQNYYQKNTNNVPNWMTYYQKQGYFPKVQEQQDETSTTQTASLKTEWKESLQDFLKTTSLHGMHYFQENSLLERAVWILCWTLSLCGACYFITIMLMKFHAAQVMITVVSTNEPIWDIPFPAVTICNTNKVSKAVAEKMMKDYGFENDQEEFKSALHLISELPLLMYVESDTDSQIKTLSQIQQKVNLTFEALMQKLMPPKEKMFISCSWLGEVLDNCSEILQMSKTDTGLCYSFNYNQIDSLNKKIAKEDEDQQRNKMKYVNGCGVHMGLTLEIDPLLGDYYATTHDFEGVLVLAHHPNEFPFVLRKGTAVNVGTEAFISVSATAISTHPRTRGLSSKQRKCYFMSEKDLKYHRLYTYENCIVECMVQTMEEMCSFVPYYYRMLSKIKDNGTGQHKSFANHMKCLIENVTSFNSLMPSDVQIVGMQKNITAMNCKCRPSCASVSFYSELSEAKIVTGDQFSNSNLNGDQQSSSDNHLIIHVFFKDMYFTKYKRDLFFTWQDLVASCGGLAGLFLGFSFISIFEMIYFFAIRPALHLMKDTVDT